MNFRKIAVGLAALLLAALIVPAHAADQSYYTKGDKPIVDDIHTELEAERAKIAAGFEAVDNAIKEGTGAGTGYTPTTGGDWTDPDPTTVRGALDTLAATIDDSIKTGNGSFTAYTPTTAADWTDPDPTTARGALDALAAALDDSIKNGNGSYTAYTPTTGAHWPDPDPTTVRGGLDAIAATLNPAKRGTATLAAGTVTVTAAITASSRIFVTRKTAAGTLGTGGLHTPSASRNVGGGTFVIEAIDVAGSLSNADTSTVDWIVID